MVRGQKHNIKVDEITSFFKAVGSTARHLGLSPLGYRMIANIGQNGMQEVPHLHVHIMGGKKMGPMVVR